MEKQSYVIDSIKTQKIKVFKSEEVFANSLEEALEKVDNNKYNINKDITELASEVLESEILDINRPGYKQLKFRF